MLEIKCPGCGAGGRVPRDKKTNRLVCKKCLRVFHLSPNGQPMLGEPPERKDAPVERAPRDTSGIEIGGSLDDLASQLRKIRLPRISPRNLGIVALVGLVAGVVYLFMSAQTVEARSKTVARAIINTEMKPITDLAVPGTEMDLMGWCLDVFKKYNEVKLVLGEDAGVTLKVLSDGSNGPAVVVVQFSPDGEKLAGTELPSFMKGQARRKGNTTYEITLYWVKNMFQSWLLDGKRTTNQTP